MLTVAALAWQHSNRALPSLEKTLREEYLLRRRIAEVPPFWRGSAISNTEPGPRPPLWASSASTRTKYGEARETASRMGRCGNSAFSWVDTIRDISTLDLDRGRKKNQENSFSAFLKIATGNLLSKAIFFHLKFYNPFSGLTYNYC